MSEIPHCAPAAVDAGWHSSVKFCCLGFNFSKQFLRLRVCN
jgi:hypothetical protein